MSSIRDFWIEELKETVEFKAIADTEDVDMAELEQNIEDLLDDQFIETATETGIDRREVLLEIVPLVTDDIETRRARVQFKWDNALPYTYRKLEQQLELIAPNQYEIILVHNDYTLTVKIELQAKGFIEAIQEVVDEMVPVNMIVSVVLRYNTYDKVGLKTYDQLAALTYSDIRNEVLP